MFCSGLFNFALLLVNIEAVATSELPTSAVNVAEVWDSINAILAVTVEPASFVNDTESPTFNSVVNKVPLPINALVEFAIDMLPVNSLLAP